jgi:hypothetical protein
MAKGPGPYLNTVPSEGKDPIMKTVDFNNNAIGSPPTAMPKGLRSGPGDLQHYGTTTNGTGGN